MSQVQRLLGSDDLVTGEAVALDLPPAGIALRVVSGLLDVLVAVLVLAGCYLVGLVAVAGTDTALVRTATVVTTVLVLIGLPTAVETLTRGRSLGKLAVGLRTVRVDAGAISSRHALTRSLVGVVEIWLLSGVPAVIAAMATARGQRLGDLVAGTYVVRDRFSAPTVRPVPMPPELAGWAAAADMAPLPDGLALAARQFLHRAPALNAASRAALGTRLTDQVLSRTAPPPPPGHHPETVLAAVLAERRGRDQQRLAREQTLRQRLRAVRERL